MEPGGGERMTTEQETPETPEPHGMNARIRTGGKPTAEDRHARLFGPPRPDPDSEGKGEDSKGKGT